MNKYLRDKSKENSKDKAPGASTAHGGLYDRHGPIPVPEVNESDSDSAWAMFEESVMRQDAPETTILSTLHSTLDDTKSDETGRDPADFGGSGYDETMAAPLKP